MEQRTFRKKIQSDQTQPSKLLQRAGNLKQVTLIQFKKFVMNHKIRVKRDSSFEISLLHVYLSLSNTYLR